MLACLLACCARYSLLALHVTARLFCTSILLPEAALSPVLTAATLMLSLLPLTWRALLCVLRSLPRDEVPEPAPCITCDARGTVLLEGRPLASWASEKQIRRRAAPGDEPGKAEEAPPEPAIPVPPHIPGHSLAFDALLFGVAAAVGAGGAAAVDALAQGATDGDKILPPQPKNKPKF